MGEKEKTRRGENMQRGIWRASNNNIWRETDRNRGKAVQSRGGEIIMYAVYGNAGVSGLLLTAGNTRRMEIGRSYHQCSTFTSIY